ncbi:MAG: NAD-dependent epimerase/dehydratase family protein [Mucilaginibacter sp.]
MKILLTGASGFLGEYIYIYLKSEGHTITTIGRRSSNGITADLTQLNLPLQSRFDLVIHAAGLAHTTSVNDKEKQFFFDVNYNGTANILKSLENSIYPSSFIFISTVAVYGKETGTLINENAPLMAKDPYGRSKIQAEELVRDWCSENGVTCTILRLPLIAGFNPPGNLRTMITGIKKGYYFNIAGGSAKKSMVLADDVAKIIPVAANVGGVFNLTDGYHPSFSELSELIAHQLNKNKPVDIPVWCAKILAKVGDILGPRYPINSAKLRKIISELTFDDSKARELLGWRPTPVLIGFKIG